MYSVSSGFPGGIVLKSPPANAGDARDTGSIPGSGRSPGERKWQPTPVFLPEISHGQRSLAGYSPWSLKEWDMTEHAACKSSLVIRMKRVFRIREGTSQVQALYHVWILFAFLLKCCPDSSQISVSYVEYKFFLVSFYFLFSLRIYHPHEDF